MKINPRIVTEATVKVIHENEGLWYRQIKRVVESSKYLDHILHSNTFDACIDTLRNSEILEKPMDRTRSKKRPIFLTTTAKLKLELDTLQYPASYIKDPDKDQIRRNQRKKSRYIPRIKETRQEKNLKMYLLLMMLDAASTELSTYEIHPSQIGKILEIINGLNINDLEVEDIKKEDGGRIIFTIYKPFSCIEIYKQEIYPSQKRVEQDMHKTFSVTSENKENLNLYDNDKPYWIRLRNFIIKEGTPPLPIQPTSPAVLYRLKIQGVSIGDLLSHQDSYQFMFKHLLFSKTGAKRVISKLEKLKIIKFIGKLGNEKRYTIADNSLRNLLRELWNIRIFVMQKINLELRYKRTTKLDEKKWLKMVYGYEDAEKIRNDNVEYLHNVKKNKIDEELIASATDEIKTLSKVVFNYYEDLNTKYEPNLQI